MDRSYFHWLLFSVIIALTHLLIAIIVFPLHREKVQLKKVLRDGSLLFFAMSLTAASFGDFLANKKNASNLILTEVAFAVAFFILVSSTVVYAIIIKDRFIELSTKMISPDFVFSFSIGISFSAIVYGSMLLCFFV